MFVWFAPERTFVLARGPDLVCQQSSSERYLFRPEVSTLTHHILSFAIYRAGIALETLRLFRNLIGWILPSRIGNRHPKPTYSTWSTFEPTMKFRSLEESDTAPTSLRSLLS
jgi:hypothetical protein